MEMTPNRWRYTKTYLEEVFGEQDEHLARLMQEAVNAGLPDIAVSADVGRFLKMLVGFTPGKTAIEVGTLAGYSTIWIARGLANDGRLITIENIPKHADFAKAQFARAQVADRIELVQNDALPALEDLAERLPHGSVDFAFIDAAKAEYPAYFERLRPLIAPGGVFVADNVLGTNRWWIDVETHPDRIGADTLNRRLAEDPDFESVGLPLREGLLVARRNPGAAAP